MLLMYACAMHEKYVMWVVYTFYLLKPLNLIKPPLPFPFDSTLLGAAHVSLVKIPHKPTLSLLFVYGRYFPCQGGVIPRIRWRLIYWQYRRASALCESWKLCHFIALNLFVVTCKSLMRVLDAWLHISSFWSLRTIIEKGQDVPEGDRKSVV